MQVTQDIFWKVPEGERFETFLKMSDEEAQIFFDDYMRRREERLKFLDRAYVRTGGGADSDLNFSIDSLRPLWAWARQRIRRRDLTPAELNAIACLPPHIGDRRLANAPLCENTLILLNDVAYYFAQVLIENFKGVNWKVCKTKLKRYGDDHQPVLGGFSPAPINPRGAVMVAALKTLDGEAGDDALLDACQKCYNLLGECEDL